MKLLLDMGLILRTLVSFRLMSNRSRTTVHAHNCHEGSSDGFGYSPNEIHIPQSMANKSNSYQQHHLRSLLLSNSPSYLNNNHTHHLGRLHGSPRAPSHLMMNMGSPVQQLQAGSAPVMKASLWDRQQIYAGGEPHEASSGYQMGAIRNMRIPGFSPSHPREISSHGGFDVSTNGGLHSPQQMGHVYHERSPMNSLPTSFGSPSERVRNRRNDANLSHADRKHYELNIDRILRGDDCRTTLMINNIPNKYTSKMLLATIDEHHRGKYDFIYLPIDFKNKCNMGYAFINMVDPIQIVAFHQTFEGRKWEKFDSEKVATLAYARIQGKAALIAHFQNSSLMNEDKRCRPILFHTDGPSAGDQVVKSRGYVEDVRLSNVRLLMGSLIIVVALVAQFCPKKFTENRDFLIACIILYPFFDDSFVIINAFKNWFNNLWLWVTFTHYLLCFIIDIDFSIFQGYMPAYFLYTVVVLFLYIRASF